MDKEIEFVLGQATFLSGLSEAEVRYLAGLIRLKQYKRREYIFNQEDQGETLYIIKSGIVKIVLSSPSGKQITLALLGCGDCFGELAVLDGEPRSADAVVKEDCELLVLHRDDFQRFLLAHPAASLRLLAALSRRLRQTDQIVHDSAFLDIRARLARTLLTLGQTRGIRKKSGIIVVSPRITQSELAEMTNATRESINKWLGYFKKQGLVQYNAGRITLLDIERLHLFLS